MASDKRLYPELEGREDGRVRAGRKSGARPQVGRRSKKAASSSEGGKWGTDQGKGVRASWW